MSSVYRVSSAWVVAPGTTSSKYPVLELDMVPEFVGIDALECHVIEPEVTIGRENPVSHHDLVRDDSVLVADRESGRMVAPVRTSDSLTPSATRPLRVTAARVGRPVPVKSWVMRCDRMGRWARSSGPGSRRFLAQGRDMRRVKHSFSCLEILVGGGVH